MLVKSLTGSRNRQAEVTAIGAVQLFKCCLLFYNTSLQCLQANVCPGHCADPHWFDSAPFLTLFLQHSCFFIGSVVIGTHEIKHP